MKIIFLVLHLGYGGVEKAVISQANLLAKKYEVEIISTYKLLLKPAFKLNENIKVKYLIKEIPNKLEWKNSLKKCDFLKFSKETFKALKIIYLREKKMIQEVKKINEGIVISTRILYTKILSKYGHSNIIKIAQEHKYHNNNKRYIKKLKKALKNIDYLLPSSKYLTNDYKKIMKNIKIVYIPLFLDYIPSVKSKLNNYNITAIGRLEFEKGFLDLISVFNKLNLKDNRFNLTIIGDGSLKPLLKEKIKNYNLDNKVKLRGYQNKEIINKVLSNTSLYIMTSFEESFGLVLIEAMSFGIPCIAFDSARGAQEIIENNKNGFLIKDRNKEEMVLKIIQYFNSNKESLSKEAIKKSNYYSEKNIESMWFEFIETILKKKNNDKNL